MGGERGKGRGISGGGLDKLASSASVVSPVLLGDLASGVAVSASDWTEVAGYRSPQLASSGELSVSDSSSCNGHDIIFSEHDAYSPNSSESTSSELTLSSTVSPAVLTSTSASSFSELAPSSESSFSELTLLSEGVAGF